jgi:hypothetical protein
MLIYFDESYDNKHKYLLLGALFNPHPKFLYRELKELKKRYNYLNDTGASREIKYNNCINNFRLKMYQEAIDIFFKSTSYFRCIVIDQSILDLSYFGKKHEDNKIKMACAYKKFAELLIAHNTNNVYNGVLLTDELKRCKGDKFIELMKQDFCLPNGKYCDMKNKLTLKHIADIKSHLENYQVGQINDLLLGCVLNNLIPTRKQYKNKLREYLVNKLQVDSLLPEYWSRCLKKYVEEYYPKFNVWYWKPNNVNNQKTPENSEVF